MAFRENLLHARAANNMTQEQLAVLVGVSRQSVAKWESGKAYPEMDKLIKLAQTFDCTLDELVQGNLTLTESTAGKSLPKTPQDIFGYDEFMRLFAKKISNGVMFIILGVACCLLFFPVAETGEWLGITFYVYNVFTALGLFVLFGGIALGLINIIPAGMEYSSFVKAHPFLEDFYSRSEKEQARKTFVNQLLTGIISIFIGVCLAATLGASPATEILGAFLMLLCTAVGVRFIIHGSLLQGRVNIAAYNQKAHEELTVEDIDALDVSKERKDELLRAKKREDKSGAWCGIIMLIATIVGLLLLFVPQYQTPYYWLVWPIGGIICAIFTLLSRALGKDE